MKHNKSSDLSKKKSVLKASLLLFLAGLMLSSGLMIAKLNAKAGVAEASVGVQSTSSYGLDIGGSTNGGIGGGTDTSPDYNYLAHKYFDLFSLNSNGTVSLDLNFSGSSSSGITGGTIIDPSDRDALNNYTIFLDSFNKQMQEGMLYLAEDGNYHLVVSETDSRNWGSGKNDYWFRMWLFIPLGHHIELSAQNAFIFGVVSAFFAIGSSMIMRELNDFIEFVKFEAWTLGDISSESLSLFSGTWVNVLTGIWSVVSIIKTFKDAIDLALKASGTLASIVSTIVTILLNLIWGSVGIPMLVNSLICGLTDDNTVVVETDPLFIQGSSWRYRY